MVMQLAAQSTQRKVELREAELRTALGIGGLRPSGQSPLVHESGHFIQPAEAPFEQAILESLFRKGLLGVTPEPTLVAEWQKALTALADPLWDVSMIVGSRGQLNYDRYFSAGALLEDSLVYYQPSGETHTICHPYGPAYILQVLDQTVDFATPGSNIDSGAELNYKEYIVLAALIDLLRHRHLEAILRRQPGISPDVTPEEVAEILLKGLRQNDPRWLVTLANTVSPFEFQLESREVQGLMEAMQLRGYLVGKTGTTAMRATEVLLGMAESILLLPAFAAFELTFIKSPETFEINYFAAVRGANVIWLLDFYELATQFPRVSLATVSGDELGVMLQRLMEESKEKTDEFLQSRKASVERQPELRRLPSPPTLRSLKVPGTVGALRSPSPSSGELSMPPGPSRTPPSPPIAVPQPPMPPSPPDEYALEQRSLPPGPADRVGLVSPPPVPPAAAPKTPLFTAAPSPPGAPLPLPPSPPPARTDPPSPLLPEPRPPLFRSAEGAVPSMPRAAGAVPPPLPPSAPPRPPGPPDEGLAPFRASLAEPQADAVGPPPHALPPWDPSSSSALVSERPCPHCGLPVVVGKKFCRHCGKSQPQTEEFLPSPVDVPAGEPATHPSQAQGSSAPTPALDPPGQPPPSATVICKVCGLALADTAHFCGHCGANVVAFRAPSTPPPDEKKCPSCCGKIAPSARFCAFCGYMVG